MKNRGLFVLIISLLFILLYFYISVRLLDGTNLSRVGLVWAQVLLAFPFLFQWIIPAVVWNRQRQIPEKLRDFLLWGAYLCLGYFSFLLFSVVARDVVWVLVRAAQWGNFLTGWERTEFYNGSVSLGLAGFSFLLIGLGLRGGLRVPPVKEVEVDFPKLSPDFEGLRIVQLSDLHIDRSVPVDFLDKVVDRVNALKPDLIAVTGDLIDGKVETLKEKVRPLARLSASLGKFYVTGNHEYYWGAEPWVEEVRSLGITPLMNSHEDVRKNGSSLTVAGIVDFASEHFPPNIPPDTPAAMAGSAGSFRLLLAHQPKSAFESMKTGFDLQLSGHTHGGQFLPWNLLIGFFQPLSRGLYRFGVKRVYVSQGTGFWGPPIRLGASSEITLLILRQRS